MRIISGIARGRTLFSPAKCRGVSPIRPTADRAREALFSIIGTEVHGARVVDLFAGTGALGLEALSRGAASALFVDGHQSALSLVRKNIDACGFSAQCTVHRRDLSRGLAFLKAFVPEGGFSLIFLDPPYGLGHGARILAELGRTQGLLHDRCLLVLEEMATAILPEQEGFLGLADRRSYGETGFWLYRVRERKNNDIL